MWGQAFSTLLLLLLATLAHIKYAQAGGSNGYCSYNKKWGYITVSFWLEIHKMLCVPVDQQNTATIILIDY